MQHDVPESFDVTDRIVAFKRAMAPRRDALTRAFTEVHDHIRRAVDAILTDTAAGRPVVPEIDYRDIRDGQRLRCEPRGDPPDRLRRGTRRVPGRSGQRAGSPSSVSISTRTTTNSARSRSGTSTSTSPA